MMKRLLNHIANMCLLMTFGIFELAIAPFTSRLWICVFALSVALLDFCGVYYLYCSARRIADAIDGYMDSTNEQFKGHLELFKIIFKDEEKPKGDN